jgi:hypothetical protein
VLSHAPKTDDLQVVEIATWREGKIVALRARGKYDLQVVESAQNMTCRSSEWGEIVAFSVRDRVFGGARGGLGGLAADAGRG